jgi:peptide-methionine (S)-S-oxide reductase
MKNLLAALAFAFSLLPAAAAEIPPGYQVATFAGGCFWCMEPPFDKLEGVASTTSGYMGGKTKNPTYREVSSGTSGHAEVVQVVYDPKKVSYEKLLETFWHNVDPTVKDQQFCDVGSQYRTAIFTHTEEQRKLAEASKAALMKSRPFKGEIVTPIVPAAEFTAAEDYHQDYYVKNPVRYKFYRNGCGRDARLKELWGDAAGK